MRRKKINYHPTKLISIYINNKKKVILCLKIWKKMVMLLALFLSFLISMEFYRPVLKSKQNFEQKTFLSLALFISRMSLNGICTNSNFHPPYLPYSDIPQETLSPCSQNVKILLNCRQKTHSQAPFTWNSSKNQNSLHVPFLIYI